MKYFKAMDKKPKINLAVIKKMFDKFPETRAFIDKAYEKQKKVLAHKLGNKNKIG